MLEILKFVFSNFWIFVGSLMILSATFEGVSKVITAIAYGICSYREIKQRGNKGVRS